MTGRIFDIQRFSIHDGPGIRTTVFLKGCPLHCLWCHNPEGISEKPLLSLAPEKCVACAACVPVCPEKALVLSKKILLDRPRCTNCGECEKVCDPHALEMVGRDATVEEVMAVVVRDLDYYRASGGGLTLSGGEPLFQPAFAAALLAAAKENGIRTCVETAGFVDWRAFEMVRPATDLFLFDWKETNPQLHESFTGAPNAPIRANLRRLHDSGALVLLRCPMIPEYNARAEHLDGIAELAREMPRLLGVELLPYHRLGSSKAQRVGLLSRMPAGVPPPDRAAIDGWHTHLRNLGVRSF